MADSEAAKPERLALRQLWRAQQVLLAEVPQLRGAATEGELMRIKQRVRRTKEQVMASKLNPSMRPSGYDKQQYVETTFEGRGRTKAPRKGY